jgi:peptidoglycan/LPS O-acetylase OafA/YrhL
LSKIDTYKNSYIPEIDGLRAIAVLIVIIFHLGVGGFSGGFVGVDIFFVISGFVITRSICSEYSKNGCVSYSNFYMRRVRRLAPSLMFVLLLSTMISIAILSSEDLQDFGGSLLHSIIGISNLYFLQGSGYFDSSALSKPLLHTWSLGVEEQYYLIWPVLLSTLLMYLSKAWIKYFFYYSFFLFFLLNIYFISDIFNSHWGNSIYLSKYVADKKSALFYFPVFRIFEFLFGALLVFVYDSRLPNRYIDDSLFLLGASLIGVSIYTITDKAMFPSFNALIIAISTLLIIYAKKSVISKAILANSLMVWIGRISYPLYLVHWPVIVFWSYLYGESLDFSDKIYLLIIIFILSSIIYKYIETPVRLHNRNYLPVTLILALVLMYTASSMWQNNGWSKTAGNISGSGNFSVESKKNYTDYNQYAHYGYTANEDGKKLIIIGDSYAKDILNIIKAGRLHGTYVISFINVPNYCQFVYGIPLGNYINHIDATKQKFCKKVHASLFSSNEIKSADYIFIASSWTNWVSESLMTSILKIKEKTNGKIYLFGKKVLNLDPMKAYLSNSMKSKFMIDQDNYSQEKELMSLIGDSNDVTYISMYELFCTDKNCSPFNKDGFPLFFDRGHLTPQGAKFFYKKLDYIFR